MTNYVVFCGGRGSASLLRYMTTNNVSTGSKITAIINGLDDGASTYDKVFIIKNYARNKRFLKTLRGRAIKLL